MKKSPGILQKPPVLIIKAAFNHLIEEPVILVPMAMYVGVQLFVLEILLFFPRWPLVVFFGPLIRRVEGEMFLHYPFNFVLLNKYFEYVRMPLYVLLNSVFLGATIVILDLIDRNQPIHLRSVFRRALASYVHLFSALLIGMGVVLAGGQLFHILVRRAMLIRSQEGFFFFIKVVMLKGTPFWILFLAILVSALLAYVIPEIVIGRRKVFGAIGANFQMVRQSPVTTLLIMGLPALLYVPLLVFQQGMHSFEGPFGPEGWAVVLVVGTFLLGFIEVLQYTAITIYYLLKKESR